MSAGDIRTWLAGAQDYSAGVALLLEHGSPSAPLVSLLQRGETGYAKERLIEALTAIAAHAVAQQAKTARIAPRQHMAARAAATVAAISTEMDDWPMSKYPVELQEARGEMIGWMREQDSLHGELRRIPTKEECYRTALRIKELDDMIHAVLYRLDTYRRTNIDIGSIQEAPKTRAELFREMLNLRTYLSRWRKGTRDASDEQVAHWKQRINIIQTTLDATGDEG
jgi:hypothetical protein